MFRKQSQQNKSLIKRQSISEKSDLVRSLLKIVQYGSSYNLINTLFGYTLSSANIPLHDKVAFQLKQKFNSMQELFYDQILSKESIVLLVVDAIQTKRIYDGDQREKTINFMNSLTYSFQEIITNPHYIYQKWEKQERIQAENIKNQRQLQKFLEEEKKQMRQVAEQAESQGWECPVCCSQIDRNSFGILDCGHIFHPQCINGYLKSKIQSNEVDVICPMEGCNKHLDVGDIYNYIDGDLKQKFQKFSFNKFVQQNNNSTAWCPTAGCTAVYQFDQALDNYRCPACKKHYCLKCRCQYHVGMTCAQYKINNSFDKNDQDFINYVKGAKYKQCPKCKYWVQRNDGCCTMTCKCGQQFCYDCGGTGCPHGSCSNSGRVLPVPVVPRPRIELPRFLGGKRKR